MLFDWDAQPDEIIEFLREVPAPFPENPRHQLPQDKRSESATTKSTRKKRSIDDRSRRQELAAPARTPQPGDFHGRDGSCMRAPRLRRAVRL